MEIHADIYEIIIQLFKWKKLPLEEVLIMLWRSRRVGHAICASPISETLVSKLSQHYGKVSEFIGYWIKCMQPSHALLVGFKQRFFSTLPVSAQNSFEHESLEITDDEIKSVASDPTFHVRPLTCWRSIAAHYYFLFVCVFLLEELVDLFAFSLARFL